MSIFNNFVGLFEVNRTLRFELVPVGKTKKLIEDYQKGEKNEIYYDEERNKAYKDVKKIIDEYYRYYIDCVLSSNKLADEEELIKVFDLYTIIKESKTEEALKDFDKIQLEFRKRISKAFKCEEKKFGLDNYLHLFGKENCPFKIWLMNLCEKGDINQEEYKHNLEQLSKYKNKENNYITCLSNFKTNRNNIFTDKADPSSIANRIINENMIKYFDNCIRYEEIILKYQDLALILEPYNCVFKPELYSKYITQKGIDEYNSLIGRKAEDMYSKGINQLINEFAQKNNLSRRDVRIMNPLFKQILSEEKAFLENEEIISDRELIESVNNAYSIAKPLINEIFALTKEYFNYSNERIFVKTDSLRQISNDIYNDWSIIVNAKANALKEMSKKEQRCYKEVISIYKLNEFIVKYFENLDDNNLEAVNIYDYFKKVDINILDTLYNSFSNILSYENLSSDRKLPNEENDKGGEGYQQLQIIKSLMDKILEIMHFYKPLYLVKSGNSIIFSEFDEDFYSAFNAAYQKLGIIINIYNRIRNYVTKRDDISRDKIRQFLGCSSLLNGWENDNNYHNNGAVLFSNENDFYLAKLNEKLNPNDIEKLKKDKSVAYRYIYRMQKPDNKTIPKNFIRSKGTNYAPAIKEYNLPIEEIIELYDKGKYKTEYKKINPQEYKESLIKLIDYFKLGLQLHSSYNVFDFKWKESQDYENIAEFYKDVINSCYTLEKTPIDFEYLLSLVEQDKILLFRIYNKDFSKYSKGKPNLHTIYWRMLFSDQNINNINNTSKPVIKLDGGAQIYFRKSSIDDNVTHPAHTPIDNKNPLNAKPQSVFDYDLKKNKRYMSDKLMFHCPIRLNFRAGDITQRQINEKVNRLIENNNDINIIGIDRGERHLLYYSIINQKGEILDQGSLNTISNEYAQTDYRALLDKREKDRQQARKEWANIDQIKDLKSGYMSNVIHKIAKLMVANNAVVVLEDLNLGFKNSRKKVEKQVYQKFEKALIDKLNYLVFKDRMHSERGGSLLGYQLTSLYNEDINKLGKQIGFIYYVNPSYTSKICPLTGFVNLLRLKYENIEKSKELFGSMRCINYNSSEDYFKFSFDYKEMGYDKAGRTSWSVGTFGGARDIYNNKEKKYYSIEPTQALKNLFDTYNIMYLTEENLVDEICAVNDAQFYRKLMCILNIILMMRYNSGKEQDSDYLLCPVKDRNNTYYDSRKANEELPDNPDANGAYHIALKGLLQLKNIDNSKLMKINLNNWLEYRQSNGKPN